FGIDANNEVYICQMGTAGQIYKLQNSGSPDAPMPATLSQVGVFSNLANLTPSTKLIPFNINVPFWSDKAIKSRWAAIPNSTTVDFSPTGNWNFPTGSVLMKHFDYAIDDGNPSTLRRL